MIETNKIYNMDCFEGMKQMSTGSVDLFIADPPYYPISPTAKEFRQSLGSYYALENMIKNLFLEWERLAKPTSAAYLFCDWRTYPVIWKAFMSCNNEFRISNMICWDFGWIKAGTHYRFTHEIIAYFTRKHTPQIPNRSLSDVWRMPHVNFTTKRLHNSQKPVEIMREILRNSSKEGDLILDPFVGSCPSGIACKELGRNFIGFEIDPYYTEIAKRRFREAKRQLKLEGFQ